MTKTIELRPLFSMFLDVESTPQMIGVIPQGFQRRVIPIRGGQFEGDRLRGVVLPGGAAWAITRTDGVIHLDVRIVLKTDQDEILGMTYVGKRNGSAEALERFRRNEMVSKGEDYLRVAVQFETAAPRLDWLNNIIAIGRADRPPEGLRYDFFEVL